MTETANGVLDVVLGNGMRDIRHQMKFRAVMMTPAIASQMLEHRHPRQRRPKESRIKLYAADMTAGFWQLTHQAVAVDVDGWLIDGQNRLEAIVASNTRAPILLITGCSRESMIALDNGMSRTVVDAARVAGSELPHGGSSFAAVAKRMMLGIKNQTRGLSNQEVLAFIEVHRKAIEFTYVSMPKNERYITQAGVRAVMARAYYRRPVEEVRGRLCQFGEVMLSGLPDNPKKDSAAIRLRNWLTQQFSGRRGSGIRPKQEMVYAKTATALDYFIRYEEMESLRETSSRELFPLPGQELDEMEENSQEPTSERG